MKTRRASAAAALMHRKSPGKFCAGIASRWPVVVAPDMATVMKSDVGNADFSQFPFSRLAIFVFTGKFLNNWIEEFQLNEGAKKL